jgi:DNA-binding NarL/FixJ family response regulator
MVIPLAKKRILLGASKDQPIEAAFGELFEDQTFEIDVVEYYNESHLGPIMSQMAEIKYDAVIPTNLGLSPHCIPQFVSLIKEAHPTTRIVVLSGYDSPDFVLDLKRRGIDDFFHMPFEPEELHSRIKQLLGA